MIRPTELRKMKNSSAISDFNKRGRSDVKTVHEH